MGNQKDAFFDNPDQLTNPYVGAKKKDADRALQTFFRTSFRTHVSIAAIADRKANILLRLNSYLLSGVLIFFKYILDFSSLSIITLVLFLLTTITSLILAALVSRPHQTVVQKEAVPSPEEAARQIFFFNHFVRMKLENYEKAFGIMMNDTGLIYGNMARELYYYGKVLSYKYRLMRTSYNVFIFGLAITVLSFLISLLFV